MDVLVLIDKLDDIIHNARSVPLTDSVMIDREEIYDILDQMRSTIPEEIKQARWIVKERQEMLSEAKQEAERVLAEAQDRAEKLASETEVVRLAEKNAQQVMEDAREREREIRLEMNLDKFIAAVRRGRERLQGRGADDDLQP
jgi:vacuolar-type H+-ATPase subunit H